MSGIIKCFNNECTAYTTKEVNNCGKPITRITECPQAVVCYDQDIKPARYYARILIDPSCQCGRKKNDNMGLCFICFDSLSPEVKRGLYKKVGHGFEQAYESALKELK